jgi:glutathione synthase/RimK-type ligase-like ATP-grasp enzyme
MEYEKLEEFLSIHDTFILKPIIGLGGTNVQKIETKTIVDRKKFYEDLKNKKMFIEEFIVQDPRWGEICPNSVNTLRVMTSVVNGKPKLFFAAARIGSGKYVVDNFHAGGMAALIDLETGKLIGNGFTKKLDEYERHPVTNIKIDGYEIPYWNEVKEMVLEAALVNENVNVVGWDVAITKDGPVIIEGNRGPGWDLVQVLLNKGTKYMLEDIKKEMKQHGLW